MKGMRAKVSVRLGLATALFVLIASSCDLGISVPSMPSDFEPIQDGLALVSELTEGGAGVVPVAMAATGFNELYVMLLSLDGTFLFDGERYGLDTTIPGCHPCLRGPVLETSEVTSTEDLRETCGDDCGWLVEDVENYGLHRFGIHNSGILTQVDIRGTLVNPDAGAPVGSVALKESDASGVGTWTSVQSHNYEGMGTWSTAAWRATFTVDARVCFDTCRSAPVTLSIQAGQVPQGAAAGLPHSVGVYTQKEASAA